MSLNLQLQEDDKEEVNMTFKLQMQGTGASSTVQWLRLPASTAGTMDLIPDQGTKIPHPTCLHNVAKKNFFRD